MDVTLGKMNYRTAVCFLQTQYLISHTFSTNCVHGVSYFVSHKLKKRTIISMNTHFMVRATYDELHSIKIISQGKLTSDGDIFFTVTQKWYRGVAALCVIQQSTNKTPQTAIQKQIPEVDVFKTAYMTMKRQQCSRNEVPHFIFII